LCTIFIININKTFGGVDGLSQKIFDCWNPFYGNSCCMSALYNDYLTSHQPLIRYQLMSWRKYVDLFAPYIFQLFNSSLNAGQFPAIFCQAFVTPVVKKPSLATSDVSSYHPTSNLRVLSKLLERIVVRQLLDRLTSADLLLTLQSGYRVCHSTETAVLHVLSHILSTVDCGHAAALVLLDLSAAFDTVDHGILLERLRLSFGFNDTAHRWFRSLAGHSTYVEVQIDLRQHTWYAASLKDWCSVHCYSFCIQWT